MKREEETFSFGTNGKVQATIKEKSRLGECLILFPEFGPLSTIWPHVENLSSNLSRNKVGIFSPKAFYKVNWHVEMRLTCKA